MELMEVLDFTNPVYAHTDSKVYEERETLQEHTQRCQKYFSRLLEKEKMQDAFETMEPVLSGDTAKEYRDWFLQAVRDVITFHDAGKINPVFQQKAMKNKAFENIHIPQLHEQNHSVLSAYIYLDCQMACLEQMHKTTPIDQGKRIYLYEIVCINAYLIMKHHSDLDSFDAFLNAIQAGGKLYNIDQAMQQKSFRQLYRGKYSQMPVSKYVDILERAKTGPKARSFAKYTYARLVFSLLTACDYYATNEYTTGTEIKQFGSVREINDLRETFEKTQRMREIRTFCPELAVKDITNLADHADEDIFYLEAPTGCGKSNVGFHCSFFLAQKGMGKIMYVYPFNNLVEQNKVSLEELFQGSNIFEKAAVVNSVTPIKRDVKTDKENGEFEENWAECNWSKSLLDRQFLNYPMILTTH